MDFKYENVYQKATGVILWLFLSKAISFFLNNRFMLSLISQFN